MKYVAAWRETSRQTGGGAGSWVPMEFGDARATLAGQLRRNLDHWSGAIPGHVKGYRDQYEEALARLEEATGPIVLTLRWHEVSITPARNDGSG
jgi:hypothetical protein